MKKLSDCPNGFLGTIVEVVGDLDRIHRLMDFGFNVGVPFELLGQAPLGGPLLILLNGVVIAIRKREAECILINPRLP